MYICDIASCTGCFACRSICPKNAIEVEIDNQGRTIPGIIKDKCIECGLCKKICPVNKKSGLLEPKRCYAVWTKSEEDRRLCSSGGVSTGIARQIIRGGGVVFGAAYDDEFNLVMKPAVTEGELEQFRGSKYVQCSTGDSYVQAKEYLICGKEVLYVGTPCQIAGLQGFLQKEYDNLYTVDIICHGTPPIKYLHKYCEEKFKGKKVTKVTFRGKYDFCFTAYEGEKVVYSKPFYKDLFFWGFLESLMYRENCYQCSYAQETRVADLTAGDFWGLNRATMKELYHGRISVVLVNSEKGELLFEQVKEQFCYEEREIQEAVNGNTQLREPSKPHKARKQFHTTYKKDGILKALKKVNMKREMRNRQFHESITYYYLKKILNKVKHMTRKKYIGE